MPDWCYNTMKISEKNYENFKQKYMVNGLFDFNKVIAMPEDLRNTISGGRIKECVAYYLLKNKTRSEALYEIKKMNIYVYGLKSSKSKKAIIADLLDWIGDNPSMFDDEFREGHEKVNHTPEEVGQHYYELYQKYGLFDWYDWSCKNWGTKWNACDTDMNDKDYLVWFDTAWCPPREIYRQIAKDNPTWEIDIIVAYDNDYKLKGRIINGQYLED